MHWEERFGEVGRRHEGLIAKFHLGDIGCSSTHWWRAIRSGRWTLESTRVLRSVAAPTTDAQRALAAVLDASPGAVLHGPSALAWQGFAGYHLARPGVARARGQSGARPSLAELHQLRRLRPDDVIVWRGVPSETALRAIWAEAAHFAGPGQEELGRARIGALLDKANGMGLLTWASLRASVDELHERGRAGTVLMRGLAEERPPGSSPTESRNERRFEEVLGPMARHFRRQVVLGGQAPVGRCDFAEVHLPLGVEVNSLVHHAFPSDREADERRYHALNDAGFTVGVIWEDDLWRRPGAVVSTVDAARHHARNRDRVVVHSPGCPWPPPHYGAPH